MSAVVRARCGPGLASGQNSNKHMVRLCTDEGCVWSLWKFSPATWVSWPEGYRDACEGLGAWREGAKAHEG